MMVVVARKTSMTTATAPVNRPGAANAGSRWTHSSRSGVESVSIAPSHSRPNASAATLASYSRHTHLQRIAVAERRPMVARGGGFAEPLETNELVKQVRGPAAAPRLLKIKTA